MTNPCINCKSESEVEASGIYAGYVKCGKCGLLKNKKSIGVFNVIVPEDPMDALLCESCQ